MKLFTYIAWLYGHPESEQVWTPEGAMTRLFIGLICFVVLAALLTAFESGLGAGVSSFGAGSFMIAVLYLSDKAICWTEDKYPSI